MNGTIGIIGAMEEEVARLKEMMTETEVQTVAGMQFHDGKLSGREVVVVRSGIGKVNAAVCSQILIDRYHVAAIINTGVAGSLRNEINIGDLVLSTDAVQHDVEAGGFGYKPGQIPQMDVMAFEADSNLLELGLRCCREVNPDIQAFAGRIMTGDQFICDKEKKDWIFETFQGYCTEMEGAAIAQTAYLNKIPFLIVRAISDKANGDAFMDYDQFEAKAIEHSVRLTKAMAEAL